ncbi:MAG: hypothetical protein GF313_11810 [Caldithrix sp.]|nr:hypothetical protein [Caldithrix sp.]
MIRKILFFLFIATISLQARSEIQWTPVLQQTAMYYASDRVTADGIGPATGVNITWNENFIGQIDIGVLWGNGNSVPMRFALGYQKSGKWNPAVYGTFGLLFGQRTEVLSEDGRRPAIPVWNAGLRIAPLRFESAFGVASAFEIGYGIGPDNGTNLELTILSVGLTL